MDDQPAASQYDILTEDDIARAGEAVLGQLMLPSARGKKEIEVPLAYVRDMTQEDVDKLLDPNTSIGSLPLQVKRMRSSHHQIARLLAEGRKAVEVSQITGFTQGRISVLKNDPSFQELLEHYKQQQDVRWADVQDRLTALGTDTLEELHDRLETNPDSFSNRSLMDLAELTLDRSGKVSKTGTPSGNVVVPNLVIQFVEPGHGGKVIDMDEPE